MHIYYDIIKAKRGVTTSRNKCFKEFPFNNSSSSNSDLHLWLLQTFQVTDTHCFLTFVLSLKWKVRTTVSVVHHLSNEEISSVLKIIFYWLSHGKYSLLRVWFYMILSVAYKSLVKALLLATDCPFYREVYSLLGVQMQWFSEWNHWNHNFSLPLLPLEKFCLF